MASSSDVNVTWHEGDRCLAPSSRDGNLREATIQRLFSTSDGNDTTASVVFAEDAEKGKREEEGVPVSKLQKIGSNNNLTEEKPFFPGSFRHHGTPEPLVMSQGEEVPYTINRYLRDYQRDGIRFIYNNYIRSRGCILGDDMGLGKTVQVIGFLAALLHKTGTWKDIENNRPQFLLTQVPSQQSKPKKVFLIVAPLSVLYNWKDELETWGHFQCVVVHGLRKEEELTRIKNGRSEIALTTYETLRLSLDQFNSIDWSAVIVDEAHKIKNPKSQITQAMKELRCEIRIGLTGTILQNSLEELWCVMDWAIPSCLGSLGHFKNKVSFPIEQGQRHSATKRTLATARKAVRALAKKISHWFLRRTKALIKDQLPKKDDRVVYCSLTDFQETVYKTVLESEDVTLMLRSAEECDCGSGLTRQSCCYETNSEGMGMKQLYFGYLAMLRKVANHAALLQSTAGTSEQQKKLVTKVCEKVFQKFPDFLQRRKDEAFEAMSDPMYSGKMKVLQKLLKYYMQRRDKVLLFSLSTKLLDVLESYCMAEGLDYSRMDGTTNARERIKIVKEFNSSPLTSLCLVSTMAGGLGLNFVGANVVVLFDPTWNPANDLQAIDRAYRIGQCRDVSVLRLISLGTVEEVMYLRQVYKQQLESSVVGRVSARRYFEAVQGTDDQKGELFGMKNLFRLQTKGTCLTRTILEREGRVEAGVMMTSCTQMDDEEGEEEERKRAVVGENGPKLNDEAAKKNRDASGTARAVLDFSSGSEDEEGWGARRKAPHHSGVDETGATNASTDPGRLSLLQHGFSRLLQRAVVKPGSGLGDSSHSQGESGGRSDLEDDGNVTGSSGKKDSPSSGGPQEHARMNRSGVSRESKTGDGRNGVRGGPSPLDERDNGGREKSGLNDVMKTKNRVVEEGNDGDSGSDEAKATTAKTLRRAHHAACHSDESDDLELGSVTRPKRARWGDKGRGAQPRSKHTDHIELFTSSDEEHTQIKRPMRGHVTTHKVAERTDRVGPPKRAVSFTGLKSPTAPGSKGMEATIDNVLGAVQGVVYTHSNQRVVGGSKAEERISRAAQRDVFGRNMYSQLPANLLLGTQEVDFPLSPESDDETPPDCPPIPAAVREQLAAKERPRTDHPPTFTSKTIHRTGHTTFIIGQTPRAICRQQLEEMSAKFQSPSVRQFAEDVLRSSSAQRLTWLQKYYTSLDHPELANMVRKHFPEPDSAQPQPETTTAHPSSSSSSTSKHMATNKRHSHKAGIESHSQSRTAQKSGPRRQKKPRTPYRNIEEPQIDVPNPQLEEREEMAREHKRIKRASVSTCGAFTTTAAIDGGGLGSDMASSSGMGPGKEAAAFLDHRDTDTPSSPDVSHGQPATSSKPTAQGREREPRPSARTSEAARIQRNNLHSPSPPNDAPSTSKGRLGCLLTDLIGDTSILDDLFRSKPKAARPPKTPPASANLSKPTTTSALAPSSDTTAVACSPSTPISQTPPALMASLPSQRSKGSRKDFWDILNEGNEESINKLTDPSEVERVCVSNTKLTAGRTRTGEDGKNAGLWKTNDKFLWKR